MKFKTALDMTALDFFAPGERKGEAALYESKWWDYKMLHPIQATEIFANCYVTARRSAFARRVDKSKAEYIRVLEREHFLECPKNVITGLWKSRRKVDALGIPYDFWCTHAIKYAERRDWKNMPHPWQLTGEKAMFESDVSMTEYVTSLWQESIRTRFHFSSHDYYRAENYRGTPYQSRHQIQVLQHIMSKGTAMRAMLIADYVLKERLVNIEAATKMFGEKIMNHSISLLNEID